MTRQSFKAWGRAAASVGAGLVLLMSFQNCGKAGFDAELDGQTDSSSSDASLAAKYGSVTAAKVEAVPFAFDAGFDTITYLSCADSEPSNSNAFFSLMAGAYATGGIKLKEDFWNYTDSNFSPNYPAKYLSKNQYKNYLADSPANKDAVPTMAIRVKNSLTDVYTPNGAEPNLGTDIVPLVGTMTDSLVMDPLIQRGVTSSYFPFSPEFKNMEGKINFNKDESTAEDYRDKLMSSGALILSFLSDPNEPQKVRAADSTAYPVRSAYGKSYNLIFAPFRISGAASGNPSRVLAGVVENDLMKSSAVSKKDWNCSRVYRVVRAKDATGTTTATNRCPQQTFDAIKGNPALRNEYEVMRRHLRADQWDINVVDRCIVPKTGASCYKEENITPLVEYDLTKECFRANGGSGTGARCLHFATVCTRD